ncbi:sodium/proline symporter PutP [Zhihengliuella halotolerans]|uniref:Sodium/proline symporter n=1 Tax=Zhihengliuella halotolerans TaxID=370736 RepID=A0A4Q8AE97_9MICC|nr:sodium/proline symporter PutP [Zhihengliuella halotolerans]RZU62607.1 sodium/proline symporter [Zhihengliuella halotolerans]
MTDTTFQTIAIVVYFAAMIAIGVYAYRQTANLDDYMLGGRRLRPGTAALSAGASDMSGWLLMGLPGAIYASGLVEAWIAIGLTVGAWLNWKFVAPRLRSYTEISNNSITVPSFLENRFRDKSRLLRIIAGAIVLVFFTFYVSSGMVAGGTFFEASFGLPYIWGMLIVALATLSYTLFGGFLGATLTDVAQGILMLISLILVPIIAFVMMGPAGVSEGIAAADAEAGINHMSLFGGASVIGVVSAVAWGLGYFGQPHIIVRFMALRSAKDAKVGRRIGISWMILTALGAVAVAFIGLAYFTREGIPLDNPETVFLSLSQVVFHPLVAGFVLAAVLAAIMSTISSQLVVSSSALVEDLFLMTGKVLTPKQQVIYGRLGVLIIAVIAGLIALDTDSNILELVGFAWAGFGSAFGPIIILALFWNKLTSAGALSGMIVGAVVSFVWGSYLEGGIFDLYEIVPGFALATLTAFIVSSITPQKDKEIFQEFETMTNEMEQIKN